MASETWNCGACGLPTEGMESTQGGPPVCTFCETPRGATMRPPTPETPEEPADGASNREGDGVPLPVAMPNTGSLDAERFARLLELLAATEAPAAPDADEEEPDEAGYLPAHWACTRCTLENKARSAECEVCGAPRGSAPDLPRQRVSVAEKRSTAPGPPAVMSPGAHAAVPKVSGVTALASGDGSSVSTALSSADALSHGRGSGGITRTPSATSVRRASVIKEPWSCPNCNRSNPKGRVNCEMCGTAHPQVEEASRRLRKLEDEYCLKRPGKPSGLSLRQAVAKLREAERMARKAANSDKEVRVIGELALVFRRMRQFQKARELHDRELELATELGDSVAQGASLNNSAVLYHTTGDMATAVDIFAAAEEELKAPGTAAWHVAQAAGNRGVALLGAGRPSDALEPLDHLVREASARNEVVEKCRGLHFMGRAHAALGDWKLAIEFHEQERHAARVFAKTGLESRAVAALGDLLLRLGRLDEACEMLDNRVKLELKLKNFAGAARGAANLAIAYLRAGRSEAAASALEAGITEARKWGNRPTVARLTGMLGLMHLGARRFEDARRCARAHLTAARDAGDGLAEVVARISIGNVSVVEALCHQISTMSRSAAGSVSDDSSDDDSDDGGEEFSRALARLDAVMSELAPDVAAVGGAGGAGGPDAPDGSQITDQPRAEQRRVRLRRRAAVRERKRAAFGSAMWRCVVAHRRERRGGVGAGHGDEVEAFAVLDEAHERGSLLPEGASFRAVETAVSRMPAPVRRSLVVLSYSPVLEGNVGVGFVLRGADCSVASFVVDAGAAARGDGESATDPLVALRQAVNGSEDAEVVGGIDAARSCFLVPAADALDKLPRTEKVDDDHIDIVVVAPEQLVDLPWPAMLVGADRESLRKVRSIALSRSFTRFAARVAADATTGAADAPALVACGKESVAGEAAAQRVREFEPEAVVTVRRWDVPPGAHRTTLLSDADATQVLEKVLEGSTRELNVHVICDGDRSSGKLIFGGARESGITVADVAGREIPARTVVLSVRWLEGTAAGAVDGGALPPGLKLGRAFLAAGARTVVVTTSDSAHPMASVLLMMHLHELMGRGDGRNPTPAQALCAAQRWLARSDIATLQDFVDDIMESSEAGRDWLWLVLAIGNLSKEGYNPEAPFAHPKHWSGVTVLVSD